MGTSRTSLQEGAMFYGTPEEGFEHNYKLRTAEERLGPAENFKVDGRLWMSSWRYYVPKKCCTWWWSPGLQRLYLSKRLTCDHRNKFRDFPASPYSMYVQIENVSIFSLEVKFKVYDLLLHFSRSASRDHATTCMAESYRTILYRVKLSAKW